jgi:hypothetical protein
MDTIEPFAYRQFDDENYVGTKIVGCDKETFTTRVNEYYDQHKELHDGSVVLVAMIPIDLDYLMLTGGDV